MADIFEDAIFKCNFVKEIFSILIGISLKFVPKHLIDNLIWSAVVQVMAWCRTGKAPSQ